jgi:hypothetical protein
MKRLLLIGLAVVTAVALGHAQPGPHIQGRSPQGWTIDVQGSAGTFTADGQPWTIEFVFRWFGQDGFANLMWFIGRKLDNYLLLFAYVNTAGTDFALWFFDYKQTQGKAAGFSGSYSVGGMQPQPTPIKDYVPRGKVPNYAGLDFRVDSAYAQITPISGAISYKHLQLVVYPIFHTLVMPGSDEFWMIGIDPRTDHTYHLIFYSNRPQTWVVDLWSGEVNLLPLGQAIITGGPVQVSRTITLGR